jgi:DNA-binding transcriptional MerR regulator
MSQSLREIAETVGMPESTLRLYRDEFEEFVGAKGEGRRRRYDEKAAEILASVAAWKRAGWKSDAIRDELKKRGRPEAQARRRTTDDRLDELILLVRQQSQELASLRASVEAQKNEIARLREKQGDSMVRYDEALRRG